MASCTSTTSIMPTAAATCGGGSSAWCAMSVRQSTAPPAGSSTCRCRRCRGAACRFFVRADGDAMSLAPAVTRTMQSMEPESPVDVRPFDDVVAGTIARPRAITVLVGVFALLTLTLASIGVYGVIAYSVRERTQEIGVRLALGATAIEVCRMVMSRALRLAAIGVVVGLIAAGVFTRAFGAAAIPRRSARSVDVCRRATGAPCWSPRSRRSSRRAGACARHPARCCAPERGIGVDVWIDAWPAAQNLRGFLVIPQSLAIARFGNSPRRAALQVETPVVGFPHRQHDRQADHAVGHDVERGASRLAQRVDQPRRDNRRGAAGEGERDAVGDSSSTSRACAAGRSRRASRPAARAPCRAGSPASPAPGRTAGRAVQHQSAAPG